jgi:hypothetical protein
VVCFLQVSPPNSCMTYCSPPRVPHAAPISSILMLSNSTETLRVGGLILRVITCSVFKVSC